MVIYLFKVRKSFLNPVISVSGFYILVQLWMRRASTRNQLKTLSDELLLDIGLSKEDVLNETKKAFWEK
ncbi:MAG: hypothetical protein ACJAWS_001251 [Oleiphilaceae bacterium]|jgi:uncharacterized protein YjiS (DUF1127 family)